MSYDQSDYTTVEQLLEPTPERLATAKAWLARRLEERHAVSTEGDVTEFAADQGVEYPYSGQHPVDERLPESQERLIPYFQWVQALRYAIDQFQRFGLLVPVVAGWNPRESPPFFNTQGPRLSLGPPGQQMQPTSFPTTADSTALRVRRPLPRAGVRVEEKASIPQPTRRCCSR